MGSNPSSFQSPSSQVPAEQVPNRPVEGVSWNMAQTFEIVTGMRLPTEAEWEYACRAGTTTAFHNGSDDDATLSVIAWHSPMSSSQSHPVGQRIPNALGLHDMHGNVWELVEDWLGPYPEQPTADPRGPVNGDRRILRGGSWNDESFYCRASRRQPTFSDYRDFGTGLRAARTP
jgi:formylglycine-generating enzyme required for sulfatase activity